MVLHQEYKARITQVHHYGYAVEVLGLGREGFIDQAKHPSWHTGEGVPAAGSVLDVIVLDLTRSPPRLSALHEDFDKGRRLRNVG